ncbi:MAG: rhodanese-like domain-containing protein [Porticoccaceae bacterium]
MKIIPISKGSVFFDQQGDITPEHDEAPDRSLEGRARHPVLEAARQRAVEQGLPYAGAVNPDDAWKLFAGGIVYLVDVRTAEERKFVGHVPNTVHIPWQTGAALLKNPRFIRELELKLPREGAILFLCRSGKRSAAAAEAATKAGFPHVFNVSEGFEGDLNGNQQRRQNGWRQRGLPWQQD